MRPDGHGSRRGTSAGTDVRRRDERVRSRLRPPGSPSAVRAAARQRCGRAPSRADLRPAAPARLQPGAASPLDRYADPGSGCRRAPEAGRTHDSASAAGPSARTRGPGDGPSPGSTSRSRRWCPPALADGRRRRHCRWSTGPWPSCASRPGRWPRSPRYCRCRSGVARVVLGDMAGLGVVTVHQTASSAGSGPDLALDGKGVEWTPSALVTCLRVRGVPNPRASAGRQRTAADRHRGDDLGQDRGGRGIRRRQDHVRRIGVGDHAADHRGRDDRRPASGTTTCRPPRTRSPPPSRWTSDACRWTPT